MFLCKFCYVFCQGNQLHHDIGLSFVIIAIQLSRQRLSHKSVKAYAAMPIGIMGRKSLALIEVHGVYQQKREGLNTFVCAVSLYVALKHLKPQSRTMNWYYT